jgi:hypothetical protein
MLQGTSVTIEEGSGLHESKVGRPATVVKQIGCFVLIELEDGDVAAALADGRTAESHCRVPGGSPRTDRKMRKGTNNGITTFHFQPVNSGSGVIAARGHSDAERRRARIERDRASRIRAGFGDRALSRRCR